MAAVSCSGRQDIETVSLLCEGLEDPLAIDSTDPHFSWIMESSRVGAAQTAGFQELRLLESPRLGR